ncbi:MAG TPA: hypothetical protein VMW10_04160, partial [Alphaproteobacteria bacterium]|nr:hypothetical protein [Alphaproteobacteria bacterium]
KAAKACEEFNDSQTRLRASLQGSSQAIAVALMPALTDIAKRITVVMADVKDAIVKNAEGIARGVLSAFKLIVQAVEGVILAFNAVKLAIFEIGEATARFLIQRLLPIAATTELLATKFGILKGVNEALFNTIKDLIWIGSEYQDQSDKSLETMTGIIGTFEKLLASLGETGEGFKGLNKTTTQTTTVISKLSSYVGLGYLMKQLYDAKISVQEFHEALKDLATYNFKEWLKETFPIKERLEEMEEDLKQYITEWESAPSALKSVFASIGLQLEFLQYEIKKKVFDIGKFWKDVNQQIEASWIRGISNMITEFKNFQGAIKQFLNTIFQMFADTIGKIVVEWIKGTISMKEAIEALGVAVKTFSAAAILWIGYVITKVFDLNEKTEQSIYLLEQQIEKARELLEEWKRIGLGINLPPGEIVGPDEGSYRELPDFSGLLNRIPALLMTMIADIRTLDFVTKKMFKGLGDLLADLSKKGADYEKIIENIRDTLGDKLFNQFKKWKDKHGKDWTDIIDWAKKYNISLSEMIPRIQRKFDQLARITAHSFSLLIAQGYNFFDALMALKEPLGMLRDKALELGLKIPSALQPIFAMFEKIAERPKLFEALSATLELFKSFVTMGYMTQDLLKDFVQSTASAVRNILDVSGNLKKALQNMGDLTKEQMMMLAPL